MIQELRQQGSQKRVLGISIERKGGDGNLSVVAPFGLLLSKGITIEVAGTPLLSAGFRTCLPAGCIVPAALTARQIGALSAGEEATVVMTATTNRQLKVKLSLAGFTAAWKRLGSL